MLVVPIALTTFSFLIRGGSATEISESDHRLLMARTNKLRSTLPVSGKLANEQDAEHFDDSNEYHHHQRSSSWSVRGRATNPRGRHRGLNQEPSEVKETDMTDNVAAIPEAPIAKKAVVGAAKKAAAKPGVGAAGDVGKVAVPKKRAVAKKVSKTDKAIDKALNTAVRRYFKKTQHGPFDMIPGGPTMDETCQVVEYECGDDSMACESGAFQVVPCVEYCAVNDCNTGFEGSPFGGVLSGALGTILEGLLSGLGDGVLPPGVFDGGLPLDGFNGLPGGFDAPPDGYNGQLPDGFDAPMQNGTDSIPPGGYNGPNGMPPGGYNGPNGIPPGGYNGPNGIPPGGYNGPNGIPPGGYNGPNGIPPGDYNGPNGPNGPNGIPPGGYNGPNGPNGPNGIPPGGYNGPSGPNGIPPGGYNGPNGPNGIPPGGYNGPNGPNGIPPGGYNGQNGPNGIPPGGYNGPNGPNGIPPGGYNGPSGPNGIPPGVYNGPIPDGNNGIPPGGYNGPIPDGINGIPPGGFNGQLPQGVDPPSGYDSLGGNGGFGEAIGGSFGGALGSGVAAGGGNVGGPNPFPVGSTMTNSGAPAIMCDPDFGCDAKLEVASVVPLVTAVCRMFETFDNMGRYENNDRRIPGFEWDFLCDDFEPLNPYLCPPEEFFHAVVCQDPYPELNPAVRKTYCAPLASIIKRSDPTLADRCELACTNYLSMDRGDCCVWECPLL